MMFKKQRGGTECRATGSTQSDSSNTPGPNESHSGRIHTRVLTSRVMFLLSLAGTAVVLAYGAHRLLTDTEQRLAREQFEAFTESALDSARKNADQRKLALNSLATVVEHAHPDASEWPFVHVNGFRPIAQDLIRTSSETTPGMIMPEGVHMGLMPIVYPDQRQEFEDYAFHVVMNGTAPTDRMYGFDASFQKYNETDASTSWGSPYKLFTPFLQHSASDILFLMNWHSMEPRGRLVDNMIKCSEERAQEMRDNQHTTDFAPKECGSITDIVDLHFKVPVEMPSAVVVQPIYPANDPTKMTGLVFSAIVWEDTLRNVFSNGVSGVDCVISTETQTFTYVITAGKVSLKGAGDLHDSSFDDYAQQVFLVGSDLRVYSPTSPSYVLTAYPNNKLFTVYETNNPMIAAIGTFCVMLFAMVGFFFFDFFVRSEFHHKDSLSKARRQFVRFISHEVRTPLNAVCMGLQLWHEELMSPVMNDDDDQRNEEKLDYQDRKNKLSELIELQEEILSNAHSAVGVLNDLLQYDKVESGTLWLEMKKISIFELIESTVFEFRQPARLKQIKCSVDYHPLLNDTDTDIAEESGFMGLPQDVKNKLVVGDECRLTQVLRNLISNALKFTPVGGTISVRTVLTSTESAGQTKEFKLHSGDIVSYASVGTLTIEVTDSGVGMTPQQISNLFKEGVQFDVNELQAGQGSGLGLYIAKGILEQHGGSLTAASDGKGCGATFTMSLPLFFDPDADVKPKDPSQLSIHHDKLSPLNILVVDDANLNRKLLLRLLRNKGHVCDEAENGRIAVERVVELTSKGERFDAVLMDYEMPEMDGCTAAFQMRQMGCDSFIVGITGTLFSEDVEKFKQCGANAVLPKPLDLSVLMDVLIENEVAEETARSYRPGVLQERDASAIETKRPAARPRLKTQNEYEV